MDNLPQEKHAMICERVLDNGIDVFYCPVCGRKMLIQWTPIIRQVVLEPGDDTAIHSATPYEVSSEHPVSEPISREDAIRLARWERWLQEIGFESWWTRGTA